MHIYLQRALEAIEQATQGLTPEQLAWQPEGKWSAAQVMEHLALAFGSTSKLLDRIMQDGGPTASSPTFYERVVTTLVVEMGFFPTGRPAPEWTRPRGMAPESVRAEIREKLVEMDGKITEAEQRFGQGRIAKHPIIGPFTARQWRKFHWVHTRHHMKQIARLRELQETGARR